LMAILLAMLRTLLDEGLDAEPLINRLNVQISRHAPSSRFITLQFVNVDPATGEFMAVNAGHLPGLIRRRTGEFEKLTDGGIALGMFDSSTYTAQRGRLGPGDLLVLYSDGITEAESPSGAPFDEEGLVALIRAHANNPSLPEIGQAIIKAVERHAQDVRFADDLTVLLARRPAESGLGVGDWGLGTGDSAAAFPDTEDGVPPIPGTETGPAASQPAPSPQGTQPLSDAS
nr:SpoIIE family protein phosphatase [Vicinamibacterales bacterium]